MGPSLLQKTTRKYFRREEKACFSQCENSEPFGYHVGNASFLKETFEKIDQSVIISLNIQ
jgi:hypothetical protein